MPTMPSVADTQPPPGNPATVSADALPTWQINGVVWSQVTVGNIVYVTGSFSAARPPGVSPGGPGEVAAGNIFAYDIRTGNRITSFNHSLNAQGRFITKSPDGSRIYVGGDFTSVNGFARGHVAAFDTASDTLVSSFSPNVGGTVRAIQATNDTVYVGGAFGVVNGQSRTRLASFSASSGGLTSWSPTADNETVWSMVLTPDRSKVVIGGAFSTINQQPAYGMGAVDAVTGATARWDANQVIRNAGSTGAITSLRADGNQVYGTAYALSGPTNFEGSWSADPTTGAVTWMNDCHGDSYDTVPIGQVLYSVSHHHDCIWIGEFPEKEPRGYQHLLASPTFATGQNYGPDDFGWDHNARPAAPFLHWYPRLNAGTYTGQFQAGWSLTGNGDYLSVGGEFTQANNAPQQGLVRFARTGLAPNKRGMENFSADLTVASVVAGEARVSWRSQWDMDNARITYQVFRDGGSSPIHTVTSSSTFWKRPRLFFDDTAVAPGTQHTYRVRASDPFGNSSESPPSSSVTIASSSVDSYAQQVLDDGASSYFRLDESSGTTLRDLTGLGDAVVSGSVSRGTTGAISGNTATTFSGGSAGTTIPLQAPTVFSIEAWFRTTTSSGGKIVGFGNSSSGLSTRHDRQLYMDNSGRILLGINNGNVQTVQSPGSYRDGQWHHALGTVGPGGMSLFVDGKRVGFDSSMRVPRGYTGFWRIGGDNLSGWNQRPSSNAFSGNIDEVAVYDTALTVEQIQQHYIASGRSLNVPTAPADAYGQTVFNDNPDMYWRLAETSGSTASDSGRLFTSGILSTQIGLTRPAPGAIPGNSAITLSGSQSIGSTYAEHRPTDFSAEIWFKTTTTTGGKLIGFGTSSSGSSSQSDRMVWMTDSGKLRFGARSRGVETFIESASSYNDNGWHHVVATQGWGGMNLYVDGVLVVSNDVGGGGIYPGAWRIGGGDSTYGGNTASFFTGSLDEAAVYPRVLTPAQVQAHFAAAGGTVSNLPPTASFTQSANGLTVTFGGSGSSDVDGVITSYVWSFGDDANDTGVSTTHTYAASGTYNVTLTVTDDDGATGSVTQQVSVVEPPNQPPSASFTATPQGLTGLFDASASSDSDGSIASYAWMFGDDTNGSGVTASHAYTASGTYNVTLTVTDNQGLATWTTRQITVTDGGGPVQIASDLFSRTLTGGWGDADQGGAWNQQGNRANFSVDNGVGRLRMPSAGSGPSIFLPGASSTDTDLQVSVSLDVAPVGGLGVDQSFLLRRVQGAGDYRAKIRFLPGGAVRIGLSRAASNGAQTVLAAETVVPGITYAAGQVLVVRAQAFGTSPTTVRMKVWRSGSPEPGAWMLTQTDSTAALQVAGAIGMHSFLDGGATNAPIMARFDDLAVYLASTRP